MDHPKRRLIYLAVFVTGMTALAVELTASRLVGTIYGNSNLVWASIIGLILVFLATGYFLGGRLADRKPTQSVMYQLMFWGGFATGFIPIVAKPIMRIASDAFDQLQFSILIGSFVVVLILLIIPMTL
ncbi:MAG: fused MFS/spermidine synthase, partial [Anaerolineales bacterium]